MDKIVSEINKVTAQIDAIEVLLRKPFRDWTDTEKSEFGSPEQLREEKMHLRKKEEQLRNEKMVLINEEGQLREKKMHLRKKEEQLRNEKMQLRRKEEQLGELLLGKEKQQLQSIAHQITAGMEMDLDSSSQKTTFARTEIEKSLSKPTI